MDGMPCIAVVGAHTSLDVTTVGELRATLDRLVANGCRRMYISLAGVQVIDSAGLGLILSQLRRMKALGGQLSLTDVEPEVYRSLVRLRMVDFLPVMQAGDFCEITELDPTIQPMWKTTFRASAQALCDARHRVNHLLERVPLSHERAFDLGLAVGEALGNAVDHTHEGGVLITATAYGDRVVVEVTDCGCGFLPATVPEHIDPASERGRGLRLMRLLADSVSISHKRAGAGMVVRLVKLYDCADGA